MNEKKLAENGSQPSNRVYCKYYAKALCLKDDTSLCSECPYHNVALKDGACEKKLG